MYIGNHLMIDGLVNEMPNKDHVERMLIEIPELIGMSILLGPYIAGGIPENPGITGILVIDFSHIAIHTFNETQIVSIDIYSCKPFSDKPILEYFNKELTWKTRKVKMCARAV